MAMAENKFRTYVSVEAKKHKMMCLFAITKNLWVIYSVCAFLIENIQTRNRIFHDVDSRVLTHYKKSSMFVNVGKYIFKK